MSDIELNPRRPLDILIVSQDTPLVGRCYARSRDFGTCVVLVETLMWSGRLEFATTVGEAY